MNDYVTQKTISELYHQKASTLAVKCSLLLMGKCQFFLTSIDQCNTCVDV